MRRHARLSMIVLLASFALLPRIGAAQDPDLQLPISIFADESSYDGKTSMLTFRGLRVSQGNLSIQADQGRATNRDFEDSRWEFSGHVIIDVQNGHMESDTAKLRFSGHRLKSAEITGSPATFRMKRPSSDVVTNAKADRLEYNFEDGVVEFSGNATITESGNRISSNYLVYDIRQQRISAKSAGEGEPKVKITYTPNEPAEPPANDEATPGNDERPAANDEGPPGNDVGPPANQERPPADEDHDAGKPPDGNGRR